MRQSAVKLPPLKAPFPWFGGKSRAAHLIWPRLGDVPNYVEPFAGSLAVLLGRPHPPRTETVNDLDAYLANFWRAVAADPEQVAHWADWPVNEADLHARHQWLVDRATPLRESVMGDPDYFDARVAGWWVWGISLWIGGGWCRNPEWQGRAGTARADRGIHQKRPRLARGGRGVTVWKQRPHLSGGGKSLHGTPSHVGEWLAALSDRLRQVRVCCGDWKRLLGPAPTTCVGLTAVLLDPPYAVADRADVYNHDCRQVAHDVRAWALEHGANPKLRIALCGYEGEHDMPATWECVPWKANGGYASARRGGPHPNCARERIWFSPHCLKPSNDLFGGRMPAAIPLQQPHA